MARPVLFDATHLVVRQGVATPTGIDRVDHAYAVEFGRAGEIAAGVQCLFAKPRLLKAETVGHLAEQLSIRWREDIALAEDPVFNVFRGFVLQGGAGAPAELQTRKRPESLAQAWGRRIAVGRWLAANESGPTVPEGALFLNLTQNPTLTPRAGRFLARRPDLKGVFLVHDLIPIDFPEFFAAGRKKDFDQVLDVMFAHGHAFITTTEAVKARLLEERKRRGAGPAPVLVAPLPLPPGFDEPLPFDRRLLDAGYVIAVGTLEPRKNHWLLLNLWREMLRAGDEPPRLLIVGARGWENASLTKMLDGTPEFRGRVLHLSGLGNAGLRMAIAHARALLMPSFVEGYGIPVIEAAALGTPVIASSGTVFHDVSQGLATLVDPLDGPGWREAVLAAARAPSLKAAGRPAPLPGFMPPTERAYFEHVRAFLDDL
jgi:glycosyltransferase involved in cell wall biosynthesis